MEKNTAKRSILVEPKVYQYSLDGGSSGRLSTFSVEHLLPRRRLSENFEWTHVPMPLFKYRFHHASALELGLKGGLPYLPVIGVAFNSMTDTTVAYAVLPNEIQAGLEGKLRATESVYLTLEVLNHQFFGDLSGNVNVSDFRVGTQVSASTSVEIGTRHVTGTASKVPYLYEDQVALTLDLKFNRLLHLNLNPYGHLIHRLDRVPGDRDFAFYGLRLFWFW